MTRYCNRESRENREERALSASGAPCLYIYIPMYIEYICTIQCTRQGATYQSTGQPILHSAYSILSQGKALWQRLFCVYTSIGRIWTEKMQGRGRERKKRMGPRGHLKTTLKRGEGEFGGEGEGGKPHPRSFTLSPSFFRWLFLLNYTPKQRSWKLDLQNPQNFLETFLAVVMNWWANFQTKS